MKIYGLIGGNISHSFSATYFKEKFYKEGITNCAYKNFEVEDISLLKEIIEHENILGLNITIPYKTSVIPLLDDLTEEAKQIQAVNTIQVQKGQLIGHNTDILGFEHSIKPLLQGRKNALILGNGGASKAVQFILKKLNINYTIVSRNTSLKYSDITNKIIGYHSIIINTTPLGTNPNTTTFPQLPYRCINTKHLLFDLVYNPEQTLFLKYGKAKGAVTKNGLEMLQIQAETSWNIWNT